MTTSFSSSINSFVFFVFSVSRRFPLFNQFPIFNVPFPSIPPPLPLPITPLPLTLQPTQTCICVPIGTCPTTGSGDGSGIIDIRIVNNVSCKNNFWHQVCKILIACVESFFLPHEKQPPTPPTAPPTVCYAGLQRCCYNGPYQCGVRYPPVAGSPPAGPGQASYGKYPWQAVLLGPGDVYQGSGVLVDARNVLTTAHKVANYS